jgi:hypothetical protein
VIFKNFVNVKVFLKKPKNYFYIYGMEKNITIQEYARMRNKSPQGMRQAIRKNHKLPGVKNIQRFGKIYLLTVETKKDGQLKY